MMPPEELHTYTPALRVLLKQYDFLRSEITQSIYLEHAAILALYTFLGLTTALILEGGIRARFEFLGLLGELDYGNTLVLLLLLIFAQVIANGFGSLFLMEQSRNRRACSFLKAIEYLINEEIGEICIYWENYIVSKLIEKKIGKEEYVKFNIPITRQYYKNRVLGVGLPVFVPNILVNAVIGLICWRAAEEGVILFMIFTVSLVITLLWSLMILYRTAVPLKREAIPRREDVLKWLEKEQELSSRETR
jgi:hypothetical protein